MQTSNTPPGSPSRPLAAGIAFWTTANTIPAGPQRAPPSAPRTRAQKRSKWGVRKFFRRGSTPNPPKSSSALPQIAEQPSINPSPQRPTARRYQTVAQTEDNPSAMTSDQPFETPRKPLPPGALSQSQWLAFANSASTQAPCQPSRARQSSVPVSPISISAMSTQYDSRPVSPISSISPASVTVSEPEFSQTRINRMSAYSYLDGKVDLSSLAASPCADRFVISRSTSPVTLTRASSTAVNISARGPYVLRSATPVSFQKAKAVEVHGPVRNPSATASSSSPTRRPKLTVITSRSVFPGVLRESARHQPTIVQPSRIQSSSASLYFGIGAETSFFSDSSSDSDTASLCYVIGSGNSGSGPSNVSDSSSDDGSIGSHAKIVKKALNESFNKRSLIKKPFVSK